MFSKRKVVCVFLFLSVFFVAPLFSQEDTQSAEKSGEGVITGEVLSLDKTLGTITVKKEGAEEKTFFVIEGETILWKGIEDVELTDVKVGEEAEVGYYTDDSGRLIASWVDVLVTLKDAPEVEKVLETEDVPELEEKVKETPEAIGEIEGAQEQEGVIKDEEVLE